ncbi:hypothetical protein F0562_020896 [Nyssa sinensis]|uniref:DUF7870 domain-containing protein n=1 Tax=Nyssa sinensis TaxID=561372 RepID=A0A5J5BR38_9ASTE|nr:hypothetical protein F0562_020896 [Nyssa sinensis]
MEVMRLRILMLLWCRIRSTRVALVGGNHTAARYNYKQLMMELACGYPAKNEFKMKHLKAKGIGLNSDTLLIIKFPDSRVLQVMSRSLFLALFILILPSIGSIIRAPSTSLNDSDIESDLNGFESLPLIFQDLADEGLLKKGHKALILGSGFGDLMDDLQFFDDNKIDWVIEPDLNRQSSIADDAFDFVFTSSFECSKFIDRVIKIGGIVVMQLSDNPSNSFQQQSNYKIVYLRRFTSTVVAMRKMGPATEWVNSRAKRRLCGVTKEAKKVALKGLEDVMLEPPRRALEKSSDSLKKIKFLPDLLGDSLEGYRRRIFITDEKNGVVDWFSANYPMKNQNFKIYHLEIEVSNREMVEKLSPSTVVHSTMTISNWLMKNVREEDYVVMKAEAEVVEEMMREKTICLVDELFLECKNQWYGGEENKGKRAYWECLALYGRLTDEGVAVHQWWG